MTFTIGCRWTGYGKEPFTVQKETAEEARAAIEGLVRSDVKIDYIDTPHHARLDLQGFRILYKDRT